MFSASTSLRTTQVANFAAPARTSNSKVSNPPSADTSRKRAFFFSFFCFFFLRARWRRRRATVFPVLFARARNKNDRFCRSRNGRIFRFNPEMGLKRERSRVNRCRCVSVASRAGVLRPTEGPKRLWICPPSGLKTSTFLRPLAYPFIIVSLLKYENRLQSPRYAWLKTKT